MGSSGTSYVIGIDQLRRADVDRVGGKSASLGEMARVLSGSSVGVPPGFAVTTAAFRRILDAAPGIRRQIARALETIDYDNFESLFRGASHCRDLVSNLDFPDDVLEAVTAAYAALEATANMPNVDVAVRSSAASEDSAGASFAGQYESFLGVRGHRDVLTACRDCLTSFFTSRGVDYRHRCGFPDDTFDFAVTVQRMARSDRACSGVIFTMDPDSGARDFLLLNSSWGLGEPIVQGQVSPDEVLIFKPTLLRGPPLDPVISQERGAKELKMVYGWGGTAATEVIETTPDERSGFSIERDDVLELATAACRLEEAYGVPLDIEWAKDGVDNRLFLVQARPMTVHGEAAPTSLERYRIGENGPPLVSGQAVGNKVAVGEVRVIHGIHGIDAFHEGDVLVTERTDPDWEPAMKLASAIVTDTGGRTSHAAIVAREIGVPCVVGTGDATNVLAAQDEVTVSCIEEQGVVYAGRRSFEREVIDLAGIPETRTDVMMIVGNPAHAIQQARLPARGVGLARLEFIIASQIGVHPRALLEPEHLRDEERAAMAARAGAHESGREYFIDRLADGVAMIGAAFHPHDVIVRLSDFKSNEYRGLLGGNHFEPQEENPMLGWRGACRYTSPEYREAFRMECEALKRVREQMGLANIKVMVPFARTVRELVATIEVLAEFGLQRGVADLEIYMMVEVPSNVILLRDFAEHVDGLSIGSNDLTQLALGLDRDAGGSMAQIGDERDPAVQALLRMALRTVRELREEGREIRIGICGQAPSDFPEITRLLVDEGIDSISVTPDAVVPTILTVAEAEGSVLD
ncbi:MAG TPA: phosphoenolpyruvate synthase [Acidobacteriota bacterium]|nr:phosphoenolpyruvate synthase [Acidobacteriota bacterium]